MRRSDQFEQCAAFALFRTKFGMKAVVVDDNGNSRFEQKRCVVGQDLERRYDLDVPIGAASKVRNRFEAPGKRSLVAKRAVQVETDAPDALMRKTGNCSRRQRLGIDHGNAASPAPERRQSFKQQTVVGPIKARLHDYKATKSSWSRRGLQLLERRNFGEVGAIRNLRIAI